MTTTMTSLAWGTDMAKYLKDMSDFDINLKLVRGLRLGSNEGPVSGMDFDEIGGTSVVYYERVFEEVRGVPGIHTMARLVKRTVDFCNDPAKAFPLIEANKIDLRYNHSDASWEASRGTLWTAHVNPLRAAMGLLTVLLDEKEKGL